MQNPIYLLQISVQVNTSSHNRFRLTVCWLVCPSNSHFVCSNSPTLPNTATLYIGQVSNDQLQFICLRAYELHTSKHTRSDVPFTDFSATSDPHSASSNDSLVMPTLRPGTTQRTFKSNKNVFIGLEKTHFLVKRLSVVVVRRQLASGAMRCPSRMHASEALAFGFGCCPHSPTVNCSPLVRSRSCRQP